MRTIFYLFLFTILSSTLAQSQDDAFVIDAYDVKVNVSADGYFDVTEVIYANFSEERRGIFRTLPEKAEVDGESFKMRYRNIDVPGWQFKDYSESGNRKIRIGDPDVFVKGRQRYEIRYRVTGAFLWFDEHTEFYWNLVGTEWPVPITLVNYEVTFPQDAYFTAQDYGVATGPEGGEESNAVIDRVGQTLKGVTTQSLQPGEGISIGVRLPPDAIAIPEGFRGQYNLAKDYLALIPAMLGAFLLGFWRKAGRNPLDRDEEIYDEYYPPDNLSAAVVGTIFDNKANNRDVIALIPEWGQQGLIRVRALDPYDGKHEMYIEKQGELDPGAPEYEQKLFRDLFADADEVLVSDLSEKFYSTMTKVRSKLKRHVLHDQLYDMRSHRIFHRGWLILLFLLGLGGGIVVIAATGRILTGALIIALGILALILHLQPPRRTEEGRALQRRLTGLRNFLRDTPQGKIDELLDHDPDYFGKMLPYAIAFGLDSQWIKLFQNREMYAPTWWYYGDPMHTTHMHRAQMSSFSEGFSINTVSSAFTSFPSSSGSGSSGGGFSGSSGGGFGGGGGGSW